MQDIKNIKELREDLLKKYNESKEDKELNNLSTYTATASAIIRSVKVELDYKKYKNDDSEIDFLTE
tara:strand:+ start:29272 stop:29469 length:198 start_codon:yes stop_codon:yes gene_type:complete